MAKKKSFSKATTFRIGCLVILLICVIYYSLVQSRSTLLASFDALVFNTMFRIRGETGHTGRVVIVDIDEKSLNALGQWPWPRDILAALVKKIHDTGAVAVGLDMTFPENDRTSPSNWFKRIEAKPLPRAFPEVDAFKRRLREAKEFDYDAILGDALFASSAVTGYAFIFSHASDPAPPGTPFSSARIQVSPPAVPFHSLGLPNAINAVVNIPEVSQGESEGFINIFPDSAGTVHKVPFLTLFDKIPFPSFALEVARLGMGAKGLTIHASGLKKEGKHAILGVSLDGHFVPTDTRGRIALNYRGEPGRFPYLPAVDVLNGEGAGALKNKFVLVGTSAAGLPDLRATPFSHVFPGVEVHATIIDNILTGDPLRHDRYTEIGITFLLVIAGGIILNLVLAFTGPLISSLTGMCFMALTLWGNYQFLFLRNQLVGLVYPLFSIIFLFTLVTLAKYIYKDREKRFIQKAFAHYISPKLVDQLVSDPEKLSLTGEQKELTLFFSDIRNFTTLSEGMNSQKLAELLNMYLTAMSDIAMAHKGTVDKYIGDAIMAIWGAPMDDPDQEENAIRASLDMKVQLDILNRQWAARGFPPLSIGIGLNTGVANVGNFGSSQRFDYTVIGDTVNLASRLESLNKYYGTTILAAEQTVLKSGDQFFCRFVDAVRVKGMTSPVRIFEPVCEGRPAPELMEKTALFDKAVSHYRSREFEKAREMFLAFDRAEKHSTNAIYLDRIETFLRNPPPDDWDAVYTFDQK